MKCRMKVSQVRKRTLAAGLKGHYSADELRGKSCVVFVNLEPKKLRGVESQGMILAAVSDGESSVKILQPDSDIEEGSRVC